MGARVTNLTFGDALAAMKKGAMVRRQCWEEDSFLFIAGSDDGQGDAIMFQGADGKFWRWVSRVDEALLAEDWEIVG